MSKRSPEAVRLPSCRGPYQEAVPVWAVSDPCAREAATTAAAPMRVAATSPAAAPTAAIRVTVRIVRTIRLSADDFHPHATRPGADQADLPRGRPREVDDAALVVGEAVVDAHDDA